MKRYTAWTLIGAFLALLVLTAVTAVQAMRPADYHDPFLPFDPLVPGQPTTVLDSTRCDTRYYFNNRGEDGYYCHSQLADGPFQSVMVTATGDRITAVWFSVADLRVGDLVYRWGRPDSIRRTRHHHLLRWADGVYAMVQLSGWYTLASPVKFLSIRERHDGDWAR